MTKEEVYDNEINPLMAKIIAICTKNKIAMLANFQLSVGDEPDLRCTTALLQEEFEPSKDQLAAFSMVKDGIVAFAAIRRSM